jgi:hypothetical protein
MAGKLEVEFLNFTTRAMVKDQKRLQLQNLPNGIPGIFYPKLVNEPPSIYHTQQDINIARYGYGSASFPFFFLFIFLSTLVRFLSHAAKFL